MTYNILIVVPARSGSVRIPAKNLQEVGGQTLVQRAANVGFSARHLLSRQNGYDVDVCVSSDDYRYGVEGAIFVHRPDYLSQGGRDSIRGVIRHAMAWCEIAQKKVYDYIVTLQPSVPVRTGTLVQRMLSQTIASRCKGAVTGVPIVPWVWSVRDENRDSCNVREARNDWTPGPYPLSQEMREKKWQEVNSVQIADRETVIMERRWDLPLLVYLMPPYATIDIDTQEDLYRARVALPGILHAMEQDEGDGILIITGINGWTGWGRNKS